MKKIIDLRSDTLTKPTQEMRKKMYDAEVGDSGRLNFEGKGEDPSVNEIEELSSEITGKETALFVPSGTMANLIALMSYCSRGEVASINEKLHIYKSEKGVFSEELAGIKPAFYKMNSNNFYPCEKDIEENISKNKAKVVCIENTNNFQGGKCLTQEKVNNICKLANNYNAKIHLDGARIFNASTYLKTPIKELVEEVDTLMFCLSKGLGAPFGSMLCGNRDTIDQARNFFKLVGGKMRQAGIYASAGIVALKKGIDHLEEDHENAKILANKIYINSNKINFHPEEVQTNIVMVDVSPCGIGAEKVQSELMKQGLKVHKMSEKHIRLVTYNGVKKNDVIKAADIINRFFATI